MVDMAIDQNLFNIATGCVGFLGGWVMKMLYSDMKDLKYDFRRHSDKIASIEVLIAGKYVTAEQFSGFIETVNRKLDSISDKIDKKADKC